MTTDINTEWSQASDERVGGARKVCKLTSYLLQYPDTAWREGLQGVRSAVQSFMDETIKRVILTFVDEAESVDSTIWQDRYVRTFDFDKKSNLYLTYALYGDERDRGPALIDLKRRYEAAGFYMELNELPDYLPVVLEFIAEAPSEDAYGVVSSCYKSLVTITDSVLGQNSPYGPLLKQILKVIPKPAHVDEEVQDHTQAPQAVPTWMGRGSR
ncbi:nitrate reductase molybdenum cofactor assembly chaperone [Paenibacillus xylanilyticus]|uniref:Nitrate reductase molybdenum cofactor assembly chaperone n=1 Tax=Paenibacillus xylanilyticus TaxID=248903 RepID=A0A7Y6C0H3_9BACL|nr:nitrate reductase molybdenum cofactor assembly chaperone [Paenibacillus xylanilyticus]NUU78327.1 nitrate reductase molybdenum cofactor assembly chaperone [Paenibacillus xylanilyticus]